MYVYSPIVLLSGEKRALDGATRSAPINLTIEHDAQTQAHDGQNITAPLPPTCSFVPPPVYSFERPVGPRLSRLFAHSSALFLSHEAAARRVDAEAESLVDLLSSRFGSLSVAQQRVARDAAIDRWSAQPDAHAAALALKLTPLSEGERAAAMELVRAPDGERLVSGFSVDLKGADFRGLAMSEWVDGLQPASAKEKKKPAPCEWLNDEIINFFIELLAVRCAQPGRPLRCHFFNTFFYRKLFDPDRGCYNYKGVARWTRRTKTDLATMDRVFVPVHVNNNHWCLAVIDYANRRLDYYDSLGGRNFACLQHLRSYIKEEYAFFNPTKPPIDLSQWSDVMVECPRQNNGSDCGMFTIKFMDYLSDNLPVKFAAQNMEYFRLRTALELKAKRIQ